MTNWMTGLATLRATLTPAPGGLGWHRIGLLSVDRARGQNKVAVTNCSGFRLIKLRSQGAGVEIFRWVLTFDDGSIQDFSINCLTRGGESRPMSVAGRRLIGVVVDYDGRRSGWGGRIEIWAQA